MKLKISTKLTKSNIQAIIDILGSTSQELRDLTNGISNNGASKPLIVGKRSLVETLSHMLYCEYSSQFKIFQGLMSEDPEIKDYHPNRDWGKQLKLEEFQFTTLLDYFSTKREILIQVLKRTKEKDWHNRIINPNLKKPLTVYLVGRSLAYHDTDHLNVLRQRIP